MKIKLSILVFLGIWHLSQAQALFEARLDTDKILIGEPVTVSLYAELNPNDKYDWPVFTDSLNGLEVWEKGDVSEKIEASVKKLQQQLVLSSFDSGFYIIKPFALAINEDTLFTDPILVQVGTVVLEEENELYGIKAPVKAPFSWMLVLIIGLSVLVIVTIIVLIVKNRKSKPLLSKGKTLDTRTAIEKLDERLVKIKRDKNWETNVKLFYTQLTDAIKSYIEDEDKIAALESTTVQLKPIVLGLPWKPQTCLNIIELLEDADMVKFAKSKLDSETHVKHLLNFEEWCSEVKQISNLKNAPNTVVNA